MRLEDTDNREADSACTAIGGHADRSLREGDASISSCESETGITPSTVRPAAGQPFSDSREFSAAGHLSVGRKYKRSVMIRVSTTTHRRLMNLKDRRELARARGQLRASRHDFVTQDDVVRYLLDHEEGTQERRRRSRSRRKSHTSRQGTPSDSGVSLYTADESTGCQPSQGGIRHFQGNSPNNKRPGE